MVLLMVNTSFLGNLGISRYASCFLLNLWYLGIVHKLFIGWLFLGCMKFSCLSRGDKVPRELRNREEFVLKEGKTILGYVSFFVQANQLVVEHLSTCDSIHGYSVTILEHLIKLAEERKLDSVHFIKEIPGSDHLNFRRESISIFTKKLYKDKQRDISHFLKEL